MSMRGKRITVYAGALVITAAGSLATLAIVDAAHDAEGAMDYALIDPFSMDTDFGR